MAALDLTEDRPMNPHAETVKHVLDSLSFGVVVGTVIGYLPALAALLSIVWTAIRIFETRTVRLLVARLAGRRE